MVLLELGRSSTLYVALAMSLGVSVLAFMIKTYLIPETLSKCVRYHQMTK